MRIKDELCCDPHARDRIIKHRDLAEILYERQSHVSIREVAALVVLRFIDSLDREIGCLVHECTAILIHDAGRHKGTPERQPYSVAAYRGVNPNFLFCGLDRVLSTIDVIKVQQF